MVVHVQETECSLVDTVRTFLKKTKQTKRQNP